MKWFRQKKQPDNVLTRKSHIHLPSAEGRMGIPDDLMPLYQNSSDKDTTLAPRHRNTELWFIVFCIFVGVVWILMGVFLTPEPWQTAACTLIGAFYICYRWR